MLQLFLFLLLLTCCSALASQERSMKARAPTDGVISAAWYASWHARDFPLSRVSWSKYTHMTYAFALPSPDPHVISLDISDELLLPQFVSMARQNNVKASISVGGWTGSRYFSTAVGSPENRTAFVHSVLNLSRTFDLDGIDFDWEYPNMQGMGCNSINANDTANFLLFLRELRDTPGGQDVELTAAVYVTPFNDASGNPSTDVSGFAEVLDWIAIMNYDVKTNPAIGAGSRSPMDDTCAPSGTKTGSAVASVAAWNKAGIPMNKLVLGVPAHAHSYDVTPALAISRANASQLNEWPSYNPANRKVGDRWDGEGGLDACGVRWGPGGVYSYWGLIETGFLNQDGSPRDGILHRYDDCSETPFVYNPETNVFVSYENARSFAAKGDFIHSSGLAGFAMWEAGGDSNDTLLDSILHASANGNPSVRTNKTRFLATAAAASPIDESRLDEKTSGVSADLLPHYLPFAIAIALTFAL